MLQYLIILLDDTSVSYCHYENPKTKRRLISLEDLKAGILFGMKENLMIQFVYPDYDLPDEYKEVIETIDHINIKPISDGENADILVLDDWKTVSSLMGDPDKIYILRTDKRRFFSDYKMILGRLMEFKRLNIVFTDIDSFTKEDFERYGAILEEFASSVSSIYKGERYPQVNILTDRILLDKMNNCNAGWENVTLAPDGRFYVCPAFYVGNSYSIGCMETGLDIKNPQLYKLAYAPICRTCDAYHCRRCIWLNKKTTLEVNTPSHEQCMIAHLERNASRMLLSGMKEIVPFLAGKEIKKISYLDPLDIRED